VRESTTKSTDIGSTLNMQRTFTYSGEGWGLTPGRTRLIVSDGSDSLRFLDPETLRETGRVTVRDGTLAIEDLNELEYVRDEIFANIWHTESPGSLRRQVA
jgi:glutaminyl-peptide cyclotransferase